MCDSSATEDEITLYSLAEEKIASGEKLISALDEFKQIGGINKIQKKITSEIIFLQKAIASKSLKANNILCSNLVHFGYLTETIRRSKDVRDVDFPARIDNKKSSFRVDIVADDGATWIKVIARNPKALNDIAFGRSNYGAKSILDHAINYSEGANNNQFRFQNPKIVFDFANEIDEELANSLRDLNVQVRINGKAIVHDEEPQIVDIKLLNLDVTSLMAFISSLTCESCNWEFDQNILTEQAVRESLFSTKKFLDDLFQDKELIACKTAIDSFLAILNVVGGQNEKKRAETFLKMIKVYPDLTEQEENNVWQRSRLGIGGKIRQRMFTIITFGLFHKAITVTANKGALEAAKMQGFNIPSIIHEARALTEQKQLTAKYVQRKKI